MPINILLVDDQMLVREGIKSLLDLSPKVTVVGEAEDGTGDSTPSMNSAPM